MPARATHKGRHHWTSWSGTPSQITEIVELAKNFMQADDDPARVQVKVVASAWESMFASADDLLEVEVADLQDIESLDVKIESTRKTGRSISLTFKRPVEKQPRDGPEGCLPQRRWPRASAG
jgi:hypothetical protein